MYTRMECRLQPQEPFLKCLSSFLWYRISHWSITTEQASNWPVIFRRHTCFSPCLAVPVPAGSPAVAAALTFARPALHQVRSSWPVVSFPCVFTIFPILCSRSVDATSPSHVLPSLPTLATITGSLCNPFCLSFFSSANASWACFRCQHPRQNDKQNRHSPSSSRKIPPGNYISEKETSNEKCQIMSPPCNH